MITNQENTWNNDTDQNQGYATNSFGNSNTDIDENRLDDTEGGGNIPGSYSSNESMTGTNSVGGEEDDLADDELEEDDYEDADLEEDTDLDGTSAGSYTGTINSSLDDPNEIPEEGQSDNEGTGYSQQEEQNQPREGADTSYSEQIDVTPPERHEFPSEGAATKTDFASRDLGRTTGRMVGHEPGTEGI
ncbi:MULTISPECIES: hypothetical protein [unclassified Mucilaginibacter]|uniref:hypothetical protein n=1 Tax=unclassified Mucilaginibacter TaxID=2617802 RepID=UPI0009697132|nr:MULTISPECIES: hypothetical protein [unclassified Mucilaginibacter]OJW14855.1 MAG: hypothetical protein BGO48_11790 [Mucilaginibacter sp. 44-25]PLW91227.1 MAG: hypothetical protein C0154_02360 [Mucilaginibacter sp.]HEK20925.1 hypothetical protein [Bacteroidota bacterium]